MPHFHPDNVLTDDSAERQAAGVSSDLRKHFYFRSAGGFAVVVRARGLTVAQAILSEVREERFEFQAEMTDDDIFGARFGSERCRDATLSAVGLLLLKLSTMFQGRGHLRGSADATASGLQSIATGLSIRYAGDEVTRAEAVGMLQGAILMVEGSVHNGRDHASLHRVATATLNVLVTLRDLMLAKNVSLTEQDRALDTVEACCAEIAKVLR